MHFSLYCVFISLATILCLCEKWNENHHCMVLGCLKTLMDATDWTVSNFLVISDGAVEVDGDFFKRYPNFTWTIYSAGSSNVTGFFNIIVFVKDFRSLNQTLSAIDIRQIDKRANLVISITEDFSSLDEIRKASSKIPAVMWKLSRTRNVYLVPCKENILAMTHFPFARDCQVGELEILDVWNGKYFENGVELFIETMLDIRGCVQNCSLTSGRLHTIHFRREFKKSGEMILGGVGGKLVSIVADKMNMKLHPLINPTANYALPVYRVIRGESILGIEIMPPYEGFRNTLEQDIGYMEESLGFCYVSDGLEISWKNFVWPLSVEAWIYIGFTSVSFCGLIFLMNLCHWGEITSDQFGIFDSLGIFLGNSRVLPKTHFGRYVIGMWIVYSLLINVAYNSGLVSFLTTPVEKRMINTFNELVVDGIAFGGASTIRNFFDDPSDPVSKQIYDKYKREFVSKLEKRIIGKQFVAGVFDSIVYGFDSNHIGNLSGRIHMLEEKVMTFQLPIFIRQDSPFGIGVRRYISQAVQSGFQDYWLKYYTRNRSFTQIRSDAPIAISLQHVTGILYFYVVGVIICSLVFLGELIWHKYYANRNSLNSILIPSHSSKI